MKYICIDYKNLLYISIFNSINDITLYKLPTKTQAKLVLKSFFEKINYIKSYYYDYNLILLIDDNLNWRKQILPLYKKQRKDIKYKFDVISLIKLFTDKKFINKMLDLGFVILNQKYLEADDLAFLFAKHSNYNNVIFITTDKDWKQILFINNNIKILNPIQDFIITNCDFKSFELETIKIYDKTYNKFLLKHILKGDVVDNIYSVFKNMEFEKEFLDFLNKNNINPYNFFKVFYHKNEIFNKVVEKYDIYEYYKTGKNKGKIKGKKIFKNFNIGDKKLDKLLINNDIINYTNNKYFKYKFNLNDKLINMQNIPKKLINIDYFKQDFKNTFNTKKIIDFCFKNNINIKFKG